jgi:hypothetical protein
MANLDGYNAEQYEPMENHDALPAGDYRAMATDSQMRQTKTGSGAFLEITWDILEGEHKGRKAWSRLNLQNPNAKAVEIAQRELSSICRAAGVLRPKDSAELHSIPIILKIGTEKRGDTGETQNRIKGYAAITNGQPAQKSVPVSGPPKPPWKR